MTKLGITLLLIAMLTACTHSNPTQRSFEPIALRYPLTTQDTLQADTFFGKRVPDLYRWLENNMAPSTENWLDEQRTLTQNYLAQLPARMHIYKRLQALWNYDYWSPPIKKVSFYYVLHRKGLQNQAVLYRMRNLRDTALQVVVNPDAGAADGTIALNNFSLSVDGSLLAYEISANGKPWNTIFIKDMETNRPLLDTLQGVQFSNIAWYRDGFFYSRYLMPEATTPPTYRFHQVFFHRVGSPQSDDELIFADRSNPQCNFSAQTTSDERFLILYGKMTYNGNALYFRDLLNENLDFTPIREDFDYDFKVIDNIDNNLLVLTNYKAPNYRLVQINTTRPEERFWEQIIPESSDVLQTVHLYGNQLVVTYIHNGAHQLKIFSLGGKLKQEILLPALGAITEWSGDRDAAQAWFTFLSFTRPPVVYNLNLTDCSTTAYKAPIAEFAGNSYEMQRVKFKSYDGTEIPLWILHKKGIKLNGASPTLLTAMNGLSNEMLLPNYKPQLLHLFQVMLENNGICAIALVRGNSDLGGNWQRDGTLLRKQTAMDDFQAAAEYLIVNKYTNPSKLAIYGQKEGGLLVGASITQRPDLYRVAIPVSGIFDLMRYPNFETGWMWSSSLGKVSKVDEFDAMMGYAPLQLAVPAHYPATLVLASKQDQMIAPIHSYKLTAALQANQQSKLPVLLRLDRWSEHPPTPKQIEETADILAFIFYNLQENVIYK